MHLPRRRFLQFVAGAAALPVVPHAAVAFDYPNRAVRIVAGYPPGSSPDIAGRVMAQWLSDRLGQQFYVDNRPGAASNIGTEVVAKSPPDGYTLLVTVSTNAVNATLYGNLIFDFRHDLVPVVGIASIPFVIVVHPAFPAKTVPELIAYAKANPGKVDMATNGVGTSPHVSGEMFMMMTGTMLIHVPYKGNYLTDLLSGQVPLAFSPLASVLEYIKAGRLDAMAVTTPARSEALPNVPTIGEYVPGYSATGWYGISAPAGTPADAIARLEAATLAAVAEPASKARLLSIGLDPAPMGTAAFGKFVADEIDKWAKVIKFADIRSS
jgi:tripartite-type tricarboxylate transporter receptor subunit TctC